MGHFSSFLEEFSHCNCLPDCLTLTLHNVFTDHKLNKLLYCLYIRIYQTVLNLKSGKYTRLIHIK